MFNVAQSFFVEKTAVNNTPTVFISSVNLFFTSKPSRRAGSGILRPGVSVSIVPIVDQKPFLDVINYKANARVEYDDIKTSASGVTPTKFIFKAPVNILTDKEYAMAISFDGDDSSFVFARLKAGEEDIDRGGVAKLSAGKVDGSFFEITNGKEITRRSNIDLKFQVNLAKFTSSSSNFKISNRPQEFIVLQPETVQNYFVGGEYVYQDVDALTGDVSVSSLSSNVVGNGTTFVADVSNNSLVVVANSTVSQVRVVNIVTNNTFMNVKSTFATTVANASIKTYQPGIIKTTQSNTTVQGTNTTFSSISTGDAIVITDGTPGNTEVRKVTAVNTSNQTLTLDVSPSFSNSQASWFYSPTGRVVSFKQYSGVLVLTDSTANATVLFANNKTVYGVDSESSGIIDYLTDVEASSIRTSFGIVTPAGTSANLSVNFTNSTFNTTSLNKKDVTNFSLSPVGNYPARVFSRSREVANTVSLFNDAKSFNGTLTFTTENPWVSPYVMEDYLDFDVYQYRINNNSTNETYSNGAAYTRYVSHSVTLAEDQIAEDLIVYLTAYKPSGTDIEVYVKLLNEEDREQFSSKNWTKMTLDLPPRSQRVSIDSNFNDLVDLKYVIPPFHSGTVFSKTFTTSSNSTILTGSAGGSNVNTFIVANTLVKVTDPKFPNTYFVDVVTSSNATTFSVSSPVTNADLISSGLTVTSITDKNSAYLDNQDYNIVKYFNSGMSQFSGYKTFAVKIVLLANDSYKVPLVQEYRAIAVSA